MSKTGIETLNSAIPTPIVSRYTLQPYKIHFKPSAMKKLCSFTLLCLFHSTLCLGRNNLDNNNETLRRVDCLLDLTFYHPDSDQCFPALERGPCDQDEWLLPDLSDPGLGRCQRMSVARGCEAIILESGEVGCREDSEDENDVAFIKVTLTSYWSIL